MAGFPRAEEFAAYVPEIVAQGILRVRGAGAIAEQGSDAHRLGRLLIEIGQDQALGAPRERADGFLARFRPGEIEPDADRVALHVDGCQPPHVDWGKLCVPRSGEASRQPLVPLAPCGLDQADGFALGPDRATCLRCLVREHLRRVAGELAVAEHSHLFPQSAPDLDYAVGFAFGDLERHDLPEAEYVRLGGVADELFRGDCFRVAIAKDWLDPSPCPWPVIAAALLVCEHDALSGALRLPQAHGTQIRLSHAPLRILALLDRYRGQAAACAIPILVKADGSGSVFRRWVRSAIDTGARPEIDQPEPG